MKPAAGILRLERRSAPRAEAQVRISFVVAGCVFDARTLDLSETGARIETEVPLDPGLVLMLRLDPTVSDAQPISAQVVWTRAQAPLYVSGLHFHDFPEGELHRLRQFVMTAMAAGGGLREPPAPDGEDDIPELSADEVTAIEPPLQQPHPAAPAAASSAFELALQQDTARRQADIARARQLVIAGKEAADRRKLETAKQLLEEAVRCMPDSADAIEELARVTYLMEDFAGAATLFDKALRIRQETRGAP